MTCLAGLRHLELWGCHRLGPQHGSREVTTFQPLLALTRLTGLFLDGCDLWGVPPQAAALTALRALGLGGNRFLGPDWEPLRPLGASLNFLDASNCALQRLPPEVSALSALQHLVIRGNAFQEEADAALRTLRCLPALTRVEAAGCDLRAAPEELAALEAQGVVVLTI